jgi:hypothetical protein
MKQMMSLLTAMHVQGHDIFRAVGEVTEIADPKIHIRPIRSLHVYFYL